jgi:two-component system phosphate regulon sensor histidine kinase PhoR
MEGVICVDLNERITSVNPAAIRFLGQEESNIINESIQSVIRHTDLQKFISQVLGGCNPEKEGIVIQDRSARYLWVHGTPLLTPRGQVVAAVIVLQDVTQIKHLETVKKDFVANVSHELKTPVTLIKGFIETLQDGIDASPEEQTRFLGIIKTHADRLDAIIDDLLTLSRLEQYDQHQDVGFEAVSLQNVIKESIESCQVKAHEKHIQIHWEPESNLFVQGNYHLILQALVNLIDNAIKYSSESTQVSILVSQTKENGIIAVSDQGVGIPKEDISRVFERFYRVDKARSRKEGGTGLGLAIVKHIAQVHNGWVEVQSQPGFGSVFSIFLPLANEA